MLAVGGVVGGGVGVLLTVGGAAGVVGWWSVLIYRHNKFKMLFFRGREQSEGLGFQLLSSGYN